MTRTTSDVDTIAAVSTAPGRSALSIVRLSGPRALEIAGSAASEDLSGAGPYTSKTCALEIEGVEDPVTLYLMPAPASYTRQHVAEIHTFGSPPLAEAVLESVLRLGARPAEPGEFTRRAFLGGRIDLAQAEAVLAVIRSRSAEEERDAQRALAGELSEEIAAACDRLEKLCVETEASIDFVEDGVEAVGPEDAAARLANILDGLPSGGGDDDAPRESGVVACIAGPPNAGKSTLFNALAGRDHALVSHIAGTTRDWLSAEIEIDGVTFVLVDTAGDSPSADELSARIRNATHRQESSARVSILVVDAAETPDAAFLTRPRPGAVLVAVNKIDLVPDADTGTISRILPGSPVVPLSALTGDGLDELRETLSGLVRSGRVSGAAHHAALSLRQERALEEARAALQRGIESSAQGLDLAASDIRDALTALGSVLGWGATEEILDAVFRDFCIGK